jgi:hypothetical protein
MIFGGFEIPLRQFGHSKAMQCNKKIALDDSKLYAIFECCHSDREIEPIKAMIPPLYKLDSDGDEGGDARGIMVFKSK